MSSLKEMKGIKPKVEYLLTNYIHLRDCDNSLISNVWYNEVDTIKDILAIDFLKIFSEGKLTSPESIRRMRQRLQEENVHLRGDNYKERHKEKEVVKQGINQ